MAVDGDPAGSFSCHLLKTLDFLTCVFPTAVRPHSAPEYKDETMTVHQVPIHSESGGQVSPEKVAVGPTQGTCV